MIRYIYILVVLAVLAGCSSQPEDSPYQEILDKPPFLALTDSIRAEPGRHELYFRRAVLLNSNDFPEPALADFKKAWSLQKEERYAFGVSTILLQKHPDSALVFLGQARQELPESVLLGLSLARAFAARNKPAEALEVCEELLKKNPGQVDVLKLKASILDSGGRAGEAIAILEQAYSITPFDVELNYILALKYAEGKDSRVIRLCDSLIRADSLGMHAEPYYYKGIYFSNINNKAKALELFNESIRRDYYFLDAHIEKGIILYDQKKFAQAYDAFNLAMTISPKYADAYYWMAKSQEALGQHSEAALNYQRAFGLDNTLIEAKEGADRLRHK